MHPIASTLKKSVSLFSVFGLSCTIGQTVGSLISWYLLATGIESKYLLIPVAIGLECCGQAVRATGTAVGKIGAHPRQTNAVTQEAKEPIHLWATFANNSYLLWICIYTLGYTITMYLIYIDRVAVLEEAKMTPEEAASFSSVVNLVSAVLTCMTQILLSAERFEDWLNVSAGLYALPAVT